MSKHVYIKLENQTSSRVLAQFYHKNTKKQSTSIGWIIDPNSTSATELSVSFGTGLLAAPILDFWFLVLQVVGGDSQGTYVSGDSSSSTIQSPGWKENQLQKADSDAHCVFTADTTQFSIALASGTVTTKMHRLRDFLPIQHVFTLMLENRSYDNLLANASISGAYHATTANTNTVGTTTYAVTSPAPTSMPRGPGHEFDDALTQLCGPDATYTPQQEYPEIKSANESGYAADYAALNPKDSMSIGQAMWPTSSPSIAAANDGNFYVAYVDSSQILHIISSDSRSWTFDRVVPGSSPSLDSYGRHLESMVVAYNDYDYSGQLAVKSNVNNQGWGTGAQMASGTSPSAVTLSTNTSYCVAFQNNQNKLSIYSNSTVSASSLVMSSLSSPSVTALPNNGWRIAAQSSSNHLCTTTSMNGWTDLNLKMKSGTNPSIASSNSGAWAIAYQDSDGHLCVYDGTSKSAKTLKLPMQANTSPSMVTDPSGKTWRIAYQTKSGALRVVSKSGKALFSGPAMYPSTNPSLTWMSTGVWHVAIQNVHGQLAIFDDHGNTPVVAAVGDIMACFDTPKQLPVLNWLAQNFMVCDQWWSSMPGPTWPNRFFAHCASSGGMDDSPSQFDVATSYRLLGGYEMPEGSIYDKLSKNKWPGSNHSLTYRFYQDCDWSVDHLFETGAGGLLGASTGAAHCHSLYSDNSDADGGSSGLGWIPQVLALKNIKATDFYSMDLLARDLKSPYDWTYTFIEPHYGNITGDTYKGGSSQHPRDDVYGGEMLIKAVYESLRNSPLWYNSILIITYDEHGGFYDSQPPDSNTATPPGDGTTGDDHGFTFGQYGARVPAIVISPLIGAGVSHETFDHSSIPKTLENCFDFGPMTKRDQNAVGVDTLCRYSIAANDVVATCPTELAQPVRSAVTADVAPQPMDAPLPQKGNLNGVLHILAKTSLELSDGSEESRKAIAEELAGLRTRGDAAAFGEKVWEQIHAAWAERAGPAEE